MFGAMPVNILFWVVGLILLTATCATFVYFSILNTRQITQIPNESQNIQEVGIILNKPDSKIAGQEVSKATDVKRVFGFVELGGAIYFHPIRGNDIRVENLSAVSFSKLVTKSEDPLAYVYARDKDSVYVGHYEGEVVEVPNSDPNTFVGLEENFAKDAVAVYSVVGMGGVLGSTPRAVPILGADPESFEVLKSGYAKDKYRVYFSAWNEQGVLVVEGADTKTFVVSTVKSSLDSDSYLARDAYRVYDFGKVSNTSI